MLKSVLGVSRQLQQMTFSDTLFFIAGKGLKNAHKLIHRLFPYKNGGASILSEKYFTRSEHPTERWWNGGWLISGIVTRCQQSVCINIK